MKKSATLLLIALASFAQPNQTEQKKPKTGLWPEDWKYTLAEGVTAKEVTYYSDGTACFAKIFFPKRFSAQGKTAGVVLGQGWAGTHFSNREVWRTLCRARPGGHGDRLSRLGHERWLCFGDRPEQSGWRLPS